VTSRSQLGLLLWWSIRRAVRVYGVIRIICLPVGLALLWFLLSTIIRHGEVVRTWPFCLGIIGIGACLVVWRIVTDKASGFTESLIWHGQSAAHSTSCTIGAYALLCGTQITLLEVLVRFGSWAGGC